MALDLKSRGVVVTLLDPGHVMVGSDSSPYSVPGEIGPDEAVRQLWKVLQSKRIDDTGRYWHRGGHELPW